jgi:hypothetical protein
VLLYEQIPTVLAVSLLNRSDLLWLEAQDQADLGTPCGPAAGSRGLWQDYDLTLAEVIALKA